MRIPKRGVAFVLIVLVFWGSHAACHADQEYTGIYYTFPFRKDLAPAQVEVISALRSVGYASSSTAPVPPSDPATGATLEVVGPIGRIEVAYRQKPIDLAPI